VEAGNWAGEHPFGSGAIKDAACAGTYTPLPPPQPTPCSARSCKDPTTCPSPLTAATCNTTSGNWEAGAVSAADFDPKVYLGCGLDVQSLSANAGDKLRVSECGLISVSGATTFNGNPSIDLEFENVVGLKNQFYQEFLTTASPISGGVFDSATAQSVWSPSLLLCAQAITGNPSSYVLLYDCSIAAPVVNLPQGTMVAGGQSKSTEAVRSAVAGAGGDMNDPDLQTLPKKGIDGTPVPAVPSPNVPEAPTTPSNGSSGPAIPGWAIFLIVLACILIIIVIIVIVVLLAGGGGGAEKF